MMTVAEYFQWAVTIVGAASAAAAVLPVPKVNGVLKALHAALNVIALNIGNAKNLK